MGFTSDAVARDERIPFVRLQQRRQDFDSGGLASAVRAKEPLDLTRFHGEIHAVQSLKGAEAFRETTKMNHGSA